MSTQASYLAFIQAAFAAEQGRVEEEIQKWRSQFSDSSLFGYSPLRFPLHLGAVAAYLFEQTGNASLAQQAARLLLRTRDLTEVYPETARARRPEYEGLPVPPLDPMFDPLLYGPAVERIRAQVAPDEYARLGEIAADSLELIWRFPEWGGHNRAMLRAASLAVCARAFPSHSRSANWQDMARELAEESWGRWSIEDTMMYQSHWLRAMIQYAEAFNLAEFNDFLQPRFTLKSMVQMLSPLGILPSYGDSHWMTHSSWEWLALLEWGARTYRDPTMKWAARRIWEERSQAESPNLYAGLVLILAHRWCDDSVPAAQPASTTDALDDLVLKKLVFRSSWDKQAAYACVNYRDEGDYARVTRDYLRTTLAVSAEKMHHGHSDEGSFAMLVHNGTLLLDESGYRESPPDGIYRADRFHNRLVWRSNAGLPGQDPWELFANNGHYRPARTERLYQTHLLDAQISRIRTSDEDAGLAWDRSIAFFPDLPAWLVIDTVLPGRAGPRTLGLLWWTNTVLARGQLSYGGSWFDTWIEQVHDWKNAQHAHLHILLPAIPGQNTPATIQTHRRDFQDEQLICASWRGETHPGQPLVFASVLWPHAPEAHDLPEVEFLPGLPDRRGAAVRLKWQGEERLLGTLTDLSTGLLAEDIRPRYTAAGRSTAYGPIQSDAAFVYARTAPGRRQAGFINGTFLEYAGHKLHQAPVSSMFQEDAGDLPGLPARFRWQTDF